MKISRQRVQALTVVKRNTMSSLAPRQGDAHNFISISENSNGYNFITEGIAEESLTPSRVSSALFDSASQTEFTRNQPSGEQPPSSSSNDKIGIDLTASKTKKNSSKSTLKKKATAKGKKKTKQAKTSSNVMVLAQESANFFPLHKKQLCRTPIASSQILSNQYSSNFLKAAPLQPNKDSCSKTKTLKKVSPSGFSHLSSQVLLGRNKNSGKFPQTRSLTGLALRNEDLLCESSQLSSQKDVASSLRCSLLEIVEPDQKLPSARVMGPISQIEARNLAASQPLFLSKTPTRHIELDFSAVKQHLNNHATISKEKQVHLSQDRNEQQYLSASAIQVSNDALTSRSDPSLNYNHRNQLMMRKSNQQQSQKQLTVAGAAQSSAQPNNASLSYPAYLKSQLEGNVRDVKKSATGNGSALQQDGELVKAQEHQNSSGSMHKPTPSNNLNRKKKSLTAAGGANQNKNGGQQLQQHQTNSSHNSQSIMQSQTSMNHQRQANVKVMQQHTSTGQEGHNAIAVYNTTQHQSLMTYPQASDAIRHQGKQRPADQEVYLLSPVPAKPHRPGQPHIGYADDPDDPSQMVALPRQIQGTGKAMGKGAQPKGLQAQIQQSFQTPQKLPTGQPPTHELNPYQIGKDGQAISGPSTSFTGTSQPASKQSRDHGHHQSRVGGGTTKTKSGKHGESLKSKYLNKGTSSAARSTDNIDQFQGAAKSHRSLTNNSKGVAYQQHARPNILAPKNSTAGANNLKVVKNHLENGSQLQMQQQQSRMPFDLANTFISADSGQNQSQRQVRQVPGAPANSLAQKINHMVTADNDLARKSIAQMTAQQNNRPNEDDRIDLRSDNANKDKESNYAYTGRSYEMHHMPPQDNLNKLQHHRMTAKIPAKVRAGAQQAPQWQSMQSVQITSPGEKQKRSTNQLQQHPPLYNPGQSLSKSTLSNPGGPQLKQQFESSELSPGARLKQNMQIYSMPMLSGGAFHEKGRATLMVTGPSASGHHMYNPKQGQTTPDVDSVAINVNMLQSSKINKLYGKRQSHPSAPGGPGYTASKAKSKASNMPLANKYEYLGTSGLQQKEPNKFPSNQFSGQEGYHHQKMISNVAQQDSSSKQSNISIDKGMHVAHPLLSKSQSGAKKRPSMYNANNAQLQGQVALEEHPHHHNSRSELNSSLTMGHKGGRSGLHSHVYSDNMTKEEEMKQQVPDRRSESYFGRLQNFLGLNENGGSNRAAQDSGIELSQRQHSIDQNQIQVRMSDIRRDVFSEAAMSPQKTISGITKLKLKNLSSEDYHQPVSSQKFESPKEPKQLSSHRFKCSCEPSSEPYACVSAYRWLSLAYGSRRFEIQKSRKSYLDLLGIKDFISMAEERQIECDITRTFPHQKIFQEAQGEGQQSLQRVLQAFSKYDAKIGYVQGMNFIVGALLLHCSEEVTFWLFVALIEDYEMRDIYMEGLPGHIKHSTLIKQLIETHLGELDDHLEEIGMNIEIFATDWYFTLFAKVIPTYQMNAFFDSFYQSGWCFFHKFTLTLLRILAPQILQMDDMSEIKQLLLLPKHKKNFYGNSQTTASVAVSGAEADINSEEVSPFSRNEDSGTNNPNNLSQEMVSSTQAQNPEPQKRTFLSSIGNLFWPSRDSGTSAFGSVSDTQLQELMEDSSVEELLKREDAWIKIIEISKRLWGKKLPDAIILQYLNDYDDMQEQQRIAQQKQERKFNNSNGSASDRNQSADEVLIGRDSKSQLAEGKSGRLTKIEGQTSPEHPHRVQASFSSNELDEDNLENPTNELSPMKYVNDSGMRMPKQTKLMFKNISEMRQVSQSKQSSHASAKRTLTEQPPLDHQLPQEQMTKSASQVGQKLLIKSHIGNQFHPQNRQQLQGAFLKEPSYSERPEDQESFVVMQKPQAPQASSFENQQRGGQKRSAFIQATSAMNGQQLQQQQQVSSLLAQKAPRHQPQLQQKFGAQELQESQSSLQPFDQLAASPPVTKIKQHETNYQKLQKLHFQQQQQPNPQVKKNSNTIMDNRRGTHQISSNAQSLIQESADLQNIPDEDYTY